MIPPPPSVQLARPSRFARLRAWFRGDGLVDKRLAACHAAGVLEPTRALHALDLRDLARAVHERREPAPATRSPQLACRLAIDSLVAMGDAPTMEKPAGFPQAPPVAMVNPAGFPQTPPVVAIGIGEGAPQTPPVTMENPAEVRGGLGPESPAVPGGLEGEPREFPRFRATPLVAVRQPVEEIPALVAVETPAPQAPPPGDVRAVELIAKGDAVWALSDEAAEGITREALALVDKRFAKVRRPLARLARARVVARFRGLAVVTSLLALVAAIVVAVIVLTRPKNLLAGKAYKTSSSSKDFDPVNHTWRNARQAIFFMTNDQAQPWVEYDLDKPTVIRRLVVENRPDCCRDRAVPLVFEVSDDHHTWREVARMTHDFYSWEPKFPAETVRYLRLRVDRTTTFHLESVGAYAR